MPAPLDPVIREAILTDVRAGDLSRNAIARKHGVANATVTKLAKDAHVVGAFDRTNTEKGMRARAFDAKVARAELIERLYGDAERFRLRAWEPYTQVVASVMGPAFVTTKLPPLRDQQAAFTSLGIAIDKAIKLEDVDNDQGAAAGRTMVNDLFGALQLAYHEIVTEEQLAAGQLVEPPLEAQP
jgi:hypothetical protein